MIKGVVKSFVKLDLTEKLIKQYHEITKSSVLVGIPEDKDARKEDENGKVPIGNAALAYIHDNGSPLQGIPRREFMKPGIKKVSDKISNEFLQAAVCKMNEDFEGVRIHLNRAGRIASNSIKRFINEGDFTPLKRGTKLGRLRKLKGAKKWDTDKREDAMGSMHPLVSTAQMRNAVTYVVKTDE